MLRNRAQIYYIWPNKTAIVFDVYSRHAGKLSTLVRNALHIRPSVILYWLAQYNKKEVHYMAGNKHISSTEKYATQEMGSLTDQLTKYHPFG